MPLNADPTQGEVGCPGPDVPSGSGQNSEGRGEHYDLHIPRGVRHVQIGVTFGLYAGILGLAILFLASVAAEVLMGNDEQIPISAVALVCFFGACAIPMHLFWAKKISHGLKWAILLGYVGFVPLVVLGVWSIGGALAFALALLNLRLVPGKITVILLLLIPLLIVLKLVACLLSTGLRDWLRLNGRCPGCRKWRFGCALPGTVSCPVCGAEMKFESVE